MRDLHADLEIISKATSGPWYIEKTYGIPEIRTKERRIAKPLYHMGSEDREVEANADFIAAAREGWPEAIERAIKAEAEVARLRVGLKRIKTTIEEYHPHDTLTLPKFSFAKELHDIALAELEVHDEG